MSELNSNVEWKLWGKDDPLYGVATWNNRQKGAVSEWTDKDFYALGESDWRDFVRHWMHYGVKNDSCLEVGCGAGRMTRQLAQFFKLVYAIDVSEAMLDYARKHVDADNVEYSVVDGLNLPQKDGSVKAIFSTHVLQHLDNVDIGINYFTELYRVLDSDGSLMVHLPIYHWPRETGITIRIFDAIHNTVNGSSLFMADLKRKRGMKLMRCTEYPLRRLYSHLKNLGFHAVEFRIFPTTSNGDLHPFIFATK